MTCLDDDKTDIVTVEEDDVGNLHFLCGGLGFVVTPKASFDLVRDQLRELRAVSRRGSADAA